MSNPNLQSFQIIQISSCSDHPVRNSAGEFIFGNHILWESNNACVDGEGSLMPNVFSYDFTSPLSSNSTLNVTLKLNNHELLGTDLLLRGLIDGSRVFESPVFTFGTAEEVTIAVCVVEPDNSPKPLSFNGDFTWAIIPKEQKQSGDEIQYACPDKTRLELYWISTNIHDIFYAGLSGISIDFLRAAFTNAAPAAQGHSKGFSEILKSI